MENKITTSGLAAMLALATGKSQNICENFVNEFFSIVAQELTRGENVRVKGFGTFKLVEVEPRKSVSVVTGEGYEIPGHTKISFVMAKELAELVNAPFNAFEAVEIADALSTDMLDGEVEVAEELMETPSQDIEESIPVIPENPEDTVEVVEDNNLLEDGNIVPPADANLSEISPDGNVADKEVQDVATDIDIKADNDNSDNIKAETDNPIVEEAVAEVGDKPAMPDVSEEDNKVIADDGIDNNKIDNDKEPAEGDAPEIDSSPVVEKSFWQRYKFVIGFIAGLCAALLAGWLIFGKSGVEKPMDDAADSPEGVEVIATVDSNESAGDSVNENDSLGTNKVDAGAAASDAEEVAAQPSDSPVYDTVSTTRYLTTIAKEHYGNFNLWPIIYEENAAILGHPDRIRPGTRVVVPPLSKYNIDPNNKEQINAVKRKGKAIYDKFK